MPIKIGMKNPIIFGFMVIVLSVSSANPIQISFAHDGIVGDQDDISPFGMITGTYTDPSLGLTIELPEGWSGFGFPGFAMINPGGPTLFDPSAMGSQATMMIVSVNVTEISKSPGFSNLSEAVPLPTTHNSTFSCNEKLTYEKLNELIVMHAFSECQDPNDKSRYSVSNIYNTARKGQIIGVGLSSNSPDSYREHLNAFEESLKTLRLESAIDHRTVWFEPLGVKSNTFEIEADGSRLDLEIDSSSEISQLEFIQGQKTLSFHTEGTNGTLGLTIIPIGKLLEGPYTVLIDGKSVQPGRIFDDQVANVTRIEVQYEQSEHDIVIMGTNVTPEFEISLIIVLSSVMAATLVLARLGTRGFHLGSYRQIENSS